MQDEHGVEQKILQDDDRRSGQFLRDFMARHRMALPGSQDDERQRVEEMKRRKDS